MIRIVEKKIEKYLSKLGKGKIALEGSVIIDDGGKLDRYVVIRGLPNKEFNRKYGEKQEMYYYIAKLKSGSKLNITEEQMDKLIDWCINKKFHNKYEKIENEN